MNRIAEKLLKIENGETAAIADIPVFEYATFGQYVTEMLADSAVHPVHYFAYPTDGKLRFICVLAEDESHVLLVLSHVRQHKEGSNLQLNSLSNAAPQLQMFEREIAENFGVRFVDHPWHKPVRYAWNRADQTQNFRNYPFFEMEGGEVHEVSVGPIHAGVIEPGHFRFVCNGELVLHLEIHLGYQHRGVESLFLQKNKIIERTVLAEQIAGDSTVAHTLAFAQAMESLAGVEIAPKLQIERVIALELERVAIHTGDLSGLATDIAYQLGDAVFGTLRTPLINYFQWWCGNRFAKGLIRVGGSRYPLTPELIQRFRNLILDFTIRFNQMAEYMFELSSVQNRFEDCGTITTNQALRLGAVGPVARSTYVNRDLRSSHPFSYYKNMSFEPEVIPGGDVNARALIRKMEITQSLNLIEALLDEYELIEDAPPPVLPYSKLSLQPDSFVVSMTEGWRGEVSHCAITGPDGNLQHYAVKDPSFHNWFALALALRDVEISDFPVNNKSFNLSYCGFDL